VRVYVVMHYKSSAIAEMAAQYCTQVEFSLSIGGYLFLTLFLSIAENIYFGILFLLQTVACGSNCNRCYGTGLTEFGEITQNKSQYAVHGYSRSPLSVTMESPYATSYAWIIYTMSQKTHRTIVTIISSYLNRFSKFFHCCRQVWFIPLADVHGVCR